MCPVPTRVAKIKVFEAAMSAYVEIDPYNDDLGIRQAVGLVAVTLPVAHLKDVPFHRLIEKLGSRLPRNRFPQFCRLITLRVSFVFALQIHEKFAILFFFNQFFYIELTLFHETICG